MSNNPIDFSSHVKSVRQVLGLSQSKLADELNVSFATVNRWENGKTTPSKLAKLSFESFYTKMVKLDKLAHE